MRVAFLGLVIAAATVTSAAHNPPKELAVGQLFDPNAGSEIDGWNVWSFADVTQRVLAGDIVTETSECCTYLFNRDDSFLLARAVPLSKVNWGYPVVRIVETLKVDPLPGEELMACSLLWIEPELNLVNPKTNEVRSFVATPDGIQQIKWIYEGSACYYEQRY